MECLWWEGLQLITNSNWFHYNQYSALHQHFACGLLSSQEQGQRGDEQADGEAPRRRVRHAARAPGAPGRRRLWLAEGAVLLREGLLEAEGEQEDGQHAQPR